MKKEKQVVHQENPPSHSPSGARASWRPRLLWMAMLAVAPALLGAKGCELAWVGSELGVCGGLAGHACEPDEFCNYPVSAQCGAADATGICQAAPEVCADIYAPVCGCDDQTYSNECEANAAGVSVASSGACSDDADPEPPQEDTCGGLTGLGCGPGQFCDYPLDALCGAADATGTCKPVPDACDDVYDPVCGCDDQTYSNACEASAAGVSVASRSACDDSSSGDPGDGGLPDDDGDLGEGDEGDEGDEAICGGLTGAACEPGEFCDYPLDALCGAADATGRCQPVPELCTAEYDPVCGCDDQTYGNACEAHRAGVSVAARGACSDGEVLPPEPAGNCGGLTGAACEPGEFCNYPLTAACGAADAMGSCTALPEACTREYRPVCGCDGQTYGNECMAHASGVSVASLGECDSEPAGSSCGGLTGEGCERGEFCNYPLDAMCGAADALGQCEPIPEVCTDESNPVCGCDDQTYGNPCHANAAGVSVAALGACGEIAEPGDGRTCGGLSGASCDDGEFCSHPLEAMCGAADATGVCATRPEACTQHYDPVCGCDGQTYGNACTAASAGVSVAAYGACE